MLASPSPKNGKAMMRANKTFLEIQLPSDTDLDRLQRVSPSSSKKDVDEAVFTSEHSSASTEPVLGVHVLWTSEDTARRAVRIVPGCADADSEACASPSASEAKQAWNVCVIQKNSFMDVTYLDDDEGERNAKQRLRRHSAPTLFATEYTRAAASMCITFEACDVDDPLFSSETTVDDPLFSSEATVAMEAEDEESCHLDTEDPMHAFLRSANVFGEESCHSDAEDVMFASEGSHKSPGRKKRDRMRPCKGKRLRYKKFMARLFELVDEDPEGFDMANIEWPPSLMCNEEGRDKVWEMLKVRIAQGRQERQNTVHLCLDSLL